MIDSVIGYSRPSPPTTADEQRLEKKFHEVAARNSANLARLLEVTEHWIDDDFRVTSKGGRYRFYVRRALDAEWEDMGKDVAAYGLDFAMLCGRLMHALDEEAAKEE